MMIIVPPAMMMDLVRQRRRELQAAAEQHRRLHPAPSGRPGPGRSSTRQPRHIRRHGWLVRRRGAALKQSG
jgi:hypothetical protein